MLGRPFVFALLLPGVMACGGRSGPVLPTAAGPDTAAADVAGAARLTFVSGETQQPVASAVIVIDGRRYTTDTEGRVTLEVAPPRGAGLDVQASEFLERRTLVASDRFTLWPARSPTGLDEDQTAQMVYGCGKGCEPLARIVAGAVLVVPSPALLADAEAMESHGAATQGLSVATQGAVSFSVAPTGHGGVVVVTTSVDAGDPAIVSMGAAAVTRRQIGRQGEIVEASVVFRSVALARRLPLVMHELGHVFGLGHSPRMGDVMWNGPELYEAPGFSSREQLAIGLMLQRKPGNRFPDSDSGMATTAAGGHDATLVCALP